MSVELILKLIDQASGPLKNILSDLGALDKAQGGIAAKPAPAMAAQAEDLKKTREEAQKAHEEAQKFESPN